MARIKKETVDALESPQSALAQYVDRISGKLQHLATDGDWEAIKSVFRVLDAHARAKELRAQGQSARAHLWLVGIGRKRQQTRTVERPNSPQPAA